MGDSYGRKRTGKTVSGNMKNTMEQYKITETGTVLNRIAKVCGMVLAVMLFNGCAADKYTEFKQETWDSKGDKILYSDEKYYMALWLMDNYDFLGKSKRDIWDKLLEGQGMER